MAASSKFVILPANQRKDKTNKLILRITHNRNHKYFDVIKDHKHIYVTQSEFAHLGTSSKKRLTEITDHLAVQSKRINQSFKEIGPNFSFEKFQALYEKGELISDCFDQKISELAVAKKFSSRDGYHWCKTSITRFKDIPVRLVDTEFIKDYVKWYGRMPPTYLKYFRHILKRNGNNSFDNFQITYKAKTKIPLTRKELKQLIKFKSEYNARQRSVDFWLMSYYGGGMNTKDWVFLEWDMIVGDFEYIDKERGKTGQPVLVPMSKPLRRLITKYANPSNELYVFDIVAQNLSHEDQYNRYRYFLGHMRRSLVNVAKQLKFSSKLTPYVSRHTHANVLHNRGATTEQIKDSMGLADLKSAQVYMHTLWIDERRKVAELLIDEEE